MAVNNGTMQVAARLAAQEQPRPARIEGQVGACAPTHKPAPVHDLTQHRMHLVSQSWVDRGMLTRSQGSAKLSPRCRGSQG
jgi:hypothetical protein